MNKKNEILKIASKYFAKYGYDGVSMDMIAKKAGITKAAIYYYFNSKNKLFETILMEKISKLSNLISLCNQKDPIKNLECYIFSIAKIYKKYPCFAAILAHEFVNGGKNINDEIIKTLANNIFKKLINILNEGVKQNIFEIDNPFSIQLMIVSSLIMNQTTENLRKKISKHIDIPTQIDIETIANSIYKKILKAILKENK